MGSSKFNPIRFGVGLIIGSIFVYLVATVARGLIGVFLPAILLLGAGLVIYGLLTKK